MADDADDGLELRPADAGALFRAEMATTNFLMGYWKGLLAVLIVGLVGVLIYGKYVDYRVIQQKSFAAKVAMVEAKLGVPVITLADAMAAGEVEEADVTRLAQELLVVSRDGNGPARVEAALKAAEMFRVAAQTEERRAALEEAVAEAEGVLAYSAQGALANLALEEGDGDGAVARWRGLVASESGFLAEQAMLELGLTLEALERVDEARQVYADFMVKYPNSSRFDKAQQRDARLAADNG